MSSMRLPFLLSSFVAPLAIAALLAGTGCGGAVEAPPRGDGPTSEAGVTDPVVDEAGVTDPVQEAGVTVPVESGAACSAPTPIDPDSAVGQACFADMQKTCEATLATCAADCACASLVASCLDGAIGLGIVECLSDPQDKAESDLFYCIYFSAPCNVTSHEAGTGD